MNEAPVLNAPAVDPAAAMEALLLDALHGRRPAPAAAEAVRPLWGFGGLHGGLSLALMVRAMQAQAAGRALVSISGHFHRPVRGAFTVAAEAVHTGRLHTALRAQIQAEGRAAVAAQAAFAEAGEPVLRAVAPEAPPAPQASDCPRFVVPEAFVPVSRQVEIRPVGDARPYAGGTEPVLTAWMRLRDDDRGAGRALDAARLVFLLDALAPSYAAVLPQPVPRPTVAMHVRLGAAVDPDEGPWVLIQARTVAARADGWLDERLDAWSPRGVHLASAEQLRWLG